MAHHVEGAPEDGSGHAAGTFEEVPPHSSDVEQALVAAGIYPAPDDIIEAATPDGLYFIFISERADDVQIFSVGPMARTPGQLAAEIGQGFRVDSVSLLNLAVPGTQAALTMLERRFTSIVLTQKPAVD